MKSSLLIAESQLLFMIPKHTIEKIPGISFKIPHLISANTQDKLNLYIVVNLWLPPYMKTQARNELDSALDKKG